MIRNVFFLFLFLLPLTVTAREYDIPTITVQAEIQDDGLIRYIEERHYRFEGDCRYAYYTLPLHGFESVENISVRQDGRALTNDNSETPGTFKVERDNDELRITWYFEVDDITEHLFTIQYDLREALVTGPDYSEWFRIFLSDQLDRSPKSFQARISLPQQIDEDEWHIWLRDTPGRVKKRTDQNLLFLEIDDLEASDQVMARILFPTRVLSEAEITDRRFGLDRVMEEEAARQEARDRERQLYTLGIGLMFVLVPASFLLFVWFYRRYGRRYKPGITTRQYLFSPPSHHPPAMIRMLILGPLNKEPDKLSLGITLFDLSRRGYFRIVEKKGDKKFLSSETPQYHLEKTGKKPGDDLYDWERELLNIVNKRIDEGATRMDHVLKWSDKADRKWWKKWRKQFKKTMKEQEWFDHLSGKAMTFHMLAQIPFLLGMIGVLFLAGAAGMIGVLFVISMMLLSLALSKRTQKGADLHAEWSAYRKALKKAPNSSFDQKEISRHFVFAIALGLSKKQMEKRLADVDEDSPLFIWIAPISGVHGSADIASGLSTLASSGTSSFSGVPGGGGASAGSAGGGAGGGAG